MYGSSLVTGIHSFEVADLGYVGNEANNYIGHSVSMAGDVNLDGTKHPYRWIWRTVFLVQHWCCLSIHKSYGLNF